MAVVNIPNVGSVNFPDSMSQDDILSAIENDILPNYAGTTAAPQNARQAPVAAAPEPAAPVVEETTPAPATPAPEPIAQAFQDSPPYEPAQPTGLLDRLKQAGFMAVPDNPKQYIPEAVKGIMSGVGGLGAMWEGVNIGVDASALNIAAKQLSNFDQIDAGTLKSSKQFLGKPSSQTFIDNAQYMNGDEATRAALREKYAANIGQRKDVIQASLATLEQYKEFAKQNKGKVEDFTSIKGVQDFTDWLKFNMGSAGVQLAPIIIAALTTGGIGAGLVGMGMAAGEQFGNRIEYVLNQKDVKGLSSEEQAAKVEKYVQDTMGVSMAVAVANGALDAVTGPVGAILRAKFAKEAAKAAGKEIAGDVALKQAVKEIPRSIIEEGLTGLTQEAFSILGEKYLGEQNLDFFDPKNRNRLINAMASEAVGGKVGSIFNVGVTANSYKTASQETQAQLDQLGQTLLNSIEGGSFTKEGIDAQAIDALDPNQKVAPRSVEDMAPPLAQATAIKQEATPPVRAVTTPPEEEMVTSTAPGISVSYPKKRTEPSFTIDPETGEVIATPVTQVEPEQNLVIERRALELRQVNGYPAEIALSVARREFAEGELDVERAPAKSVTGRIEPSISVSEQGTATTEGIAPSDTTGLAAPVEDTESLVGREEAEPTALSDIPTLTERAPAAEPSKTQAEINQERQAAQKAAAPTASVEQAQLKLVEAETAVAEAVTPEAKKDATKQRNVARQEVKQAQAAEPATVDEPTQVAAFKTSKGSEYVVDETGKTSRTKKSKGKGQGETYAPHNAVYVNTTAQNAILEDMQGLFGTGGSIRIGYVANNSFNTISDLSQLPNNVEPVVAVINKQTGQAVAVHKASTEPKVGLHPVEKLYNDDGTSSTHLGNDITEITKSPAATTTTVEALKRGRGRPAKPKVEVAEPVALKPKGRPKVELTPEEQAARAEARKKVQGELIKAQRAVDRAVAKLQEKVDTNRFDTSAALETATDILRQERNQAIYVLSAAASNPMFRNVESSGVKAKQFLASNAITLQERANIAERLKFEETRSKRKAQAAPDSRFAKLGPSGISTKTNRGLNKFSNAADAAAYIAKSGTVFERALARRLLPFLTGVNLVIADTEENTIGSAKEVLGNDTAAYFANTSFGEAFKMIVLRGENYGGTAAHGVNNVTFLHEALHAALAAKIDQAMRLVKAGRVKEVPANLRSLVNDLYGIMNRAQDNYDALKASGEPISEQLQSLFEGIGIGTDMHEFLSYGMTDAELQKFLLGTPALDARDRSIIDRVKNLFTKFVETLRRAFDLGANHQSAFQDLIFATEGLLIEEEYAPAEVKELKLAVKNLNASTAKVDKNLEQVKLSPDRGVVEKATEENIVKGHTYNDFNDLLQARLDAMGNGFITKTLATLQTADIIRWQGDAIPALKSIDTLIEKMAGSRINMEQAFAKKADKFAAFIRKVGKKKILLSDAMHLARLNSVSPSLFADRADALATDKRMVQLDKLLANPTTPQEELPAITRKRTIRESQINQTFDAWKNLGTLKGGQDMYRMVRQFYKDANVLTRTLLDERIERLNVKGSIDDPSTPKGKLMLAVRRMQEDSDFKGVDEYFPFMRYGDFWLRVNGPQGKEFYLFESGTKRNEFQKKRARQLGIDPNAESEIFDAGDDLTALRTKYSPESKMLADMFEVIDNEMDKPGVDKDALKDALYQTYLMTLPEESYRKQFLHAENVTGFSSDVFRNFTTSASRIASQSAKLAYGDQISAELQRARDTLTGMPISKKTKLELFVNEIGKRVEDELNPAPESKAVARINQFAYYSLLTGIASAITQTSALPMLVMPVLNQEYGYGSSAAKFAKYMAFWKSVGVTQESANGEVVYVAPTMGESSLVKSNPILQRAFQEAIDRGLTSQTNSSVLSNRNRTPDSAYANLPQAALRTTATAMSSLFTGAERMTREMTYLMTFELEYAKTKDFDASVQKAVDTVQELLGRYDAFNRPRIMRNALGRTVGQFKMYAVNITSFFVRNAYNMFAEAFKGNPKEAVAAMHRLTGVLTMAAVFGGVTAFPMYSLVTSTIDLVLNNLGDDDEEKKRRIAENPYTAFSSDLRFRYEFLPRLFGDIKLTGLDGKQRTLAAVLEKGVVSELGDFNIGSRTTYDGMWFRDAKPGNTTTETIINYLVANLGPAVSSGLSMTGAVDDFNNGKIARGFERISPALFKNFFTAARLASEGAKTPAGETVMTKDEFSSFNIVMQALGFQSTQLARYQENNYKLQQETVAANKTRSDILKNLDNAILDSDASNADVERVFNRIDKFNDRYIAMKHLRIAPDTIKQVLDKAKGKEKFMFRGMYIRKEDLPYLLELRDVTERPQ